MCAGGECGVALVCMCRCADWCVCKLVFVCCSGCGMCAALYLLLRCARVSGSRLCVVAVLLHEWGSVE